MYIYVNRVMFYNTHFYKWRDNKYEYFNACEEMFIRNVFVCAFCNWKLRVNDADPYIRQIKNIRANEYALYIWCLLDRASLW